MTVDLRLQRLAAELAGPLLNYFARRVDPPTDAADLLNETLLVMCRRSGDLPANDEQARMWAFGVARRVLSTHQRGSRRRGALVERLRQHLWVHRADGATPEVDRLHTALDALDPLDQEIIRLIHWDGFTQVEIAQLLDRPQGTVRSRYARARAALKKELHDTASADFADQRLAKRSH